MINNSGILKVSPFGFTVGATRLQWKGEALLNTKVELPQMSLFARKSRALQSTHAILTDLFDRHGPRAFAIRLWNGQLLPATDNLPPRFTLVLTHPGALRRMFLPPGELTVAEAYLRGDFDLEGDVVAAMELATTFAALTPGEWLRLARQVLTLPVTEPPDVFQAGRQPIRLRGRLHSRDRDRAAVTYHYDVGNEFYALFLGKTMAYTCAYFPTSDADLDSAQTAKFEHICRKLRLQPGERLLDIGCGWGGLVIHAAQHYGVQAVGITLSQPQAEFARDRVQRVGLADRVQIEVRDYRDLNADQSFDKIAGVGVVEHVGRANLPTYFARAYGSLRPDGLFLNQGITEQPNATSTKVQEWIQRTFFQRDQFFQRYVFPDGGAGPIGGVLASAEQAGFEVRDMESLREHYALTVRHWIRNLEAQHAAVVRLQDERTYRVWRLLLAGGVQLAEQGQANIFQTLLSKRGSTTVALPLTRADLYQ